jgi:hypothetical protein
LFHSTTMLVFCLPIVYCLNEFATFVCLEATCIVLNTIIINEKVKCLKYEYIWDAQDLYKKNFSRFFCLKQHDIRCQPLNSLHYRPCWHKILKTKVFSHFPINISYNVYMYRLNYFPGNEIKDYMFKQIQIEKYVIKLLIPNAQPENSGTYRCKLHTADGQHSSKVIQIWVNRTGNYALFLCYI